MTPKQLAELDVYLAAGFDFPTAMAMIQPDDSGQEDADEPPTKSPPREFSPIELVFAILIGVALLGFVIWLNG